MRSLVNTQVCGPLNKSAIPSKHIVYSGQCTGITTCRAVSPGFIPVRPAGGCSKQLGVGERYKPVSGVRGGALEKCFESRVIFSSQ